MPHAFAGYPAPFIFDLPNGSKTQQLIWGDFVTLFNEDDGPWTKVRSRRTTGWMKASDLQAERLLEVNFVDIGQGDGVFVVTPDDRFILIDAGEADNMLRFLSWRFNLRAHPDRVIRIHRAVITHSALTAGLLRPVMADARLAEEKRHRLCERQCIQPAAGSAPDLAPVGTSENNRRARFYAITKAGRRQLAAETENWERIAGVMARSLRRVAQS
jgi:hypothetical protein